jgi:hypothetical protein
MLKKHVFRKDGAHACTDKRPKMCNFVDWQGYRVVYRSWLLEINHAKVWPWCVQVVRVWRAGRVCVEDVASVRGMRSRRCLLGL